jgi:hypothetical protein
VVVQQGLALAPGWARVGWVPPKPTAAKALLEMGLELGLKLVMAGQWAEA